MSRLARHGFVLAILIAGCFGGCNLFPAESLNPPDGQVEPPTTIDSPGSDGSTINEPEGTGVSGSDDADGAPPNDPDGNSGGSDDDTFAPPPPPPPPMPPGAWEVDQLPGIQTEIRILGDGTTEVVSERPIQENVGVLFGSNGELLAIRALGATGYVPLTHAGNELHELDSWIESSQFRPVSRTFRVSIASQQSGHVHLEIGVQGQQLEAHVYDFIKDGDSVRISALIVGWNYPVYYHSVTSVFEETPAHRVPDAPAPFVGAWTIGTEPPQQNGEPGFSFFYDQLGRLSSASFGSMDRWVGSPGVSSIVTTGPSAASPFATLRSEQVSWNGRRRDIREATLEVENRSIGTYSMRHQIIDTAEDGTETVILDEQSGLTQEIARRLNPPAPPATISTADVPGAVPALAGAWEAEIPGEIQVEGDPPEAAVRRVGIEFDDDGRFNRVRIPESTGYLARPPAASYEYKFFAPHSLEYRADGARLVMVEHERSTTDRRKYITATYAIDITVTPEGARVHYVEDRLDLIHDDSTFRFEGEGPVALRAGPLPVALTGRWEAELTGTQEGWTLEGCFGPIVEHPPETAARDTYLVFDNAGRLSLSSAASVYGAREFGGWHGTGSEITVVPGRADDATVWGISYSSAFWRDTQVSNHDRTRVECNQDCIVDQSSGVPMLTADVTDRYFSGSTTNCPYVQRSYFHFLGSGEMTPRND
ncbi:MAG: hypothetical protein IT450_20185 [Phycisphaerales bacterium]|nr:hypothetical protein [Phycisphaerales bacterium]